MNILNAIYEILTPISGGGDGTENNRIESTPDEYVVMDKINMSSTG